MQVSERTICKMHRFFLGFATTGAECNIEKWGRYSSKLKNKKNGVDVYLVFGGMLFYLSMHMINVKMIYLW